MTSLMPIAIALHLIAAVVWVGGMFFAYMALRPVAAQLLDPPLRLPLWASSFAKFFPWVWLAVVLLPATGYWMVFQVFGGMAQVGLHVHLMQGIGWLMILLYLHLYFALFRKLKFRVAEQNWPAAGEVLAKMRKIIGINLSLGLILVLIASGGRYL